MKHEFVHIFEEIFSASKISKKLKQTTVKEKERDTKQSTKYLTEPVYSKTSRAYMINRICENFENLSKFV